MNPFLRILIKYFNYSYQNIYISLSLIIQLSMPSLAVRTSLSGVVIPIIYPIISKQVAVVENVRLTFLTALYYSFYIYELKCSSYNDPVWEGSQFLISFFILTCKSFYLFNPWIEFTFSFGKL